MNNPLLSVIVPVYNTEKYLSRCINSIINQTYKNLEILIVDDGSIDKSWSIIESFSNKDKRIKAIRQQNKGGAAARNAALDIAGGDYITFVDSDDYIDENMYKIMLNEMNIANAEMAICSFTVNNTPDDRILSKKMFNNHDLMKELFLDNLVTSHIWRKIYPKKCFVNNRFPIQSKVVHDMAIDHYFLKNIDNAIYLDAKLYSYTFSNENNLSNSNSKKVISSLNRAKVFKERLEFADTFYPDLSNIVLPQLCMFLMSSYVKLVKFERNNKKDIDYIIQTIKKEKDRLLSCKDISILYKIVIFSIYYDIKPLIWIASELYFLTLGK